MGVQNSIDEIILKNVGENGFFIKAGGSDPRDQNNTELLESKGCLWVETFFKKLKNPYFLQKKSNL